MTSEASFVSAGDDAAPTSAPAAPCTSAPANPCTSAPAYVLSVSGTAPVLSDGAETVTLSESPTPEDTAKKNEPVLGATRIEAILPPPFQCW